MELFPAGHILGAPGVVIRAGDSTVGQHARGDARITWVLAKAEDVADYTTGR
ncbi:hypothetical protein AB0O34_06200 [Sphaerisporangium sp. NPDC088356]|uniref:hypothetical protein n=1 Tax=Sphaerisporangium sp. NPDC088356 TaxID=3154871 RepID=UPI00341BC04D